MDYENLAYEPHGRVVQIVLDRPRVLNALSRALRDELQAALTQADEDPGVGAIVLTGEGRAFCSGVDLSDAGPEPTTPEAWHPRLSGWLDLIVKVWTLPTPVIAAVNGHAIGTGCDLVLAADLAIASTEARFSEPEVAFFSISSPLIMPWVIGMKKTKELLLAGTRIDAHEAERFGLVNRVVAPNELRQAALDLAGEVAKSAPRSLAYTKRAVNRSYEIRGLRAALDASIDDAVEALLGEPVADREARQRFTAANGFRAFFKVGYVEAVEQGRALPADPDTGPAVGRPSG